MKKFVAWTIVFLFCGRIAAAQASWPTYGGDPQRSGWERTDARINKDTVKDLQLLWKMKLETQPKGSRQLTPPVILGRLISYRGFKELAFVGSNSDIVYALDADLGAMFWQRHLEYSVREPRVTASSWACPGGLTAMPTMPAPAGRGAPGGGGAGGGAGGRGAASNGFIGGLASVYALSSDGRLHRLNTSTGDDMTQPVSVLPANAKAYSLNIVDNVIYTVTGQDCNGNPNAVWAIDLTGDALKTTSYSLTDGSAWGAGGPAIGSDGTVYVQTSTAVLALTARDLKLKQSFTLPEATTTVRDTDMNVTSPVVFSYKNRDVVVASGRDGRLYLLDPASFGAPLYRTPPLAAVERNSAERGIWGHISTWQDAEGTRWVLAPVWGPLHAELKAAGLNGVTPNGSIVAFKLQEQAGKPVLTPAWVSRDMSSPVPPVVASGVVFALSAGEYSRQAKETGIEERAKGRATLYALDATTGKELYSSRNLVATPAALNGLTVANGRVYFGAIDGTFYGFGIYIER